MRHCILALAFSLGPSTGYLSANTEIRLPPFLGHDRKGSYDVEIRRTEVFNGRRYKPVEGSFHVDVTEKSIRVVTRRLTFSSHSPSSYQSEKIYSKLSGNLLTLSTDNGTKPSQVVYARNGHVDGEAEFYSGFHGVSVINGVFTNTDGSLWDFIRGHSEEIVANKPVLPLGVEVGLSKRDGYWLLEHVRIHLVREPDKRLYSTKFYDFKPPTTDPLSLTEKLDCEYGTDDSQQKYRYELSCKYERDQSAVIQMEIAIQNYRPDVVVPPLSNGELYTPIIVSVPNGTRVDVVGESTIEYMWQDGRIVRRIDSKAIDAAKSASFRSSSRWRVTLAVAFLISLLLVIAVRVWSRRKAKASL